MINLSIIIVSFNTKKLTLNCLSTIKKSLTGDLQNNTEILVIDNASTDGTIPLLKKEFPEVKIIGNQKNHGFTIANNQGLTIAKGDWVLLLNSDTLLETSTLSQALDYAYQNPLLGVLGCQLRHHDGSLEPSAGYLPNLFNIFLWMTFIDDIPYIKSFLNAYHVGDPLFYTKVRQVGWVSGAFFLLRRKIIKEAGLLDENIFMYGEEVEWCLRIKKAGYQIIYFPDATITHLKGASGEGKTAGIIAEYSALEYIFRKHMSSWELPILRSLLRLGALLRLLLFGIILSDKTKYTLYAKAFRLS